MLYRVTGFEQTTLVLIGTDCTGSYQSNYHPITTMTASYIKDGIDVRVANVHLNI